MHKLYSIFLFILTALAIAGAFATFWVINNLNPEESIINLTAFYLSSGIMLLGISSLPLFYLRSRFGLRELVKRHFYVSLRQGFWISLMFSASMFLQSQDLFTWLNSTFLIIALLFLESYFIYNERKPE